ncbi:MAG: ABC transporter ATP-binding protein [Actinomycetota bacterium]
MTAVLSVEDLTVAFDGIRAADRLSARVTSRELVGIIGPNGAGKTTFLNLVTGYVRPQSGRVQFMEHDITGVRPHQITALGVGRSFQVPQLFTSMTVLDNVLVALSTARGGDGDLWRSLRQDDRVRGAGALLRDFSLDDYADRLASELPEGGRKLLDVGLALALEPKLLLMDEPTSGVSVEEKFAVMDTLTSVLRDSGVTAVFVEHDMEVVRRYADRVLVLSQGKMIADGTPDEVLGDLEIQRAVSGWGAGDA